MYAIALLVFLLPLLLSCGQLAGTDEPDEAVSPSATESSVAVGVATPVNSRECDPARRHIFLPSATAQADLFSPTLEERMVGGANVTWARLSSISHSLSDDEYILGTVVVEFDVVEHLRPLSPEHEDIRESFQFQVEVGYKCIYPEDMARDMEAISEAASMIGGFFVDRELIVFSDQDEFSAWAEFSVSSPEPTIHLADRVYRRWKWNDGTNWMLEDKEVQSEEDNPVFIDPPSVTVSLEEIREKLDTVMKVEEELGEACAWAMSNHERYVRSAQESYYYNVDRQFAVQRVEGETGSADCVP